MVTNIRHPVHFTVQDGTMRDGPYHLWTGFKEFPIELKPVSQVKK